MKNAVYPGSFNPWHAGHTDVLEKALGVFDTIFVAVGVNPDKSTQDVAVRLGQIEQELIQKDYYDKRVQILCFREMVVDLVNHLNTPIHGIVKGLRNGQDLEYERVQQYTNEDLAKEFRLHLPPTVYFVTHRDFSHVSSSAIRIVNELKKGRN